MTAKIIRFPGKTRLNVNAEAILQDAIEAGVDRVVVIGYTKDDEEYFASSIADGGEALWLAERFKHVLITFEVE